MLAFTPKQASEFANKWIGNEADNFLQEIERVSVGDLKNTPLMLAIGIKVYIQTRKLPDQRSTIYEEFVQILLAEAYDKELKLELGERLSIVARPALERVALAMTEHPQELSADVIDDVVTKYLQDSLQISADEAKGNSKRLIQVMSRRSGVFVRRGRSYDFVHLTVRDYLAACAVDSMSSRSQTFLRKWISSHRFGRQEDVVLFLLGSLSDDKRLVNKLVGYVYYPPIVDRLFRTREEKIVSLIFAANCLANGVEINERFRDHIVHELKEMTRNNHVDLFIRIHSLPILGRLGYVNDATRTLSEIALDEQQDIKMRQISVLTIMELGNTDEVVSIAKKPRISMEVRDTAISLLFAFERVEELTRLARDGLVRRDVRKKILAMLYRLNMFDVIREIVFDQQIDEDVRVYGITLLNRSIGIEDMESNDDSRLVSILKDNNAGVQSHLYAIMLMAQLGHIDKLMEIIRDNTINLDVRKQSAMGLVVNHAEIAKGLISDEDLDLALRESTARALATSLIKSENINEIIELVSNNNINVEVRHQLLKALVKEHVETVEMLVQNGALDQEIREIAVNTLAMAFMDEIKELEQNENVDINVRKGAASLLSDSIDPQGVMALVNDKNSNPRMKIAVIGILLEAGRSDIVLELIRDQNSSMRLRQAALMILNSAKYHNELMALARDESLDFDLRKTSVMQLISLEFRDEIQKLVRDEQINNDIRRYAIFMLGKLVGVDALVNMVRDKQISIDLRVDIIQMLFSNGNVEEILELLRDKQIAGDIGKATIVLLGMSRHVAGMG